MQLLQRAGGAVAPAPPSPLLQCAAPTDAWQKQAGVATLAEAALPHPAWAGGAGLTTFSFKN